MQEVTCASFQIAIHGDYVLPDTWRHPHNRVLGHRHPISAGANFARTKPLLTPSRPRELQGSYHFFDSEHPGQFGHITAEVLSPYWDWRLAR